MRLFLVLNLSFYSRIELLEFSSDLKDSKSKLQEYLQKIEADLPVYEIITEHQKKYR